MPKGEVGLGRDGFSNLENFSDQVRLHRVYGANQTGRLGYFNTNAFAATAASSKPTTSVKFTTP